MDVPLRLDDNPVANMLSSSRMAMQPPQPQSSEGFFVASAECYMSLNVKKGAN